jgi:hypothetical protein
MKIPRCLSSDPGFVVGSGKLGRNTAGKQRLGALHLGGGATSVIQQVRKGRGNPSLGS